jgi:hypothetical protein
VESCSHSRVFEPGLVVDQKFGFGGSDNVQTEGSIRARRCGGLGNIFKSRCSEMRFQVNPDGTILAQNDIELLCEARGGLVTVC